MNKRAFICSLPALGVTRLTQAADRFTGDLKDHPKMSPEKCSYQDPESMWSMLTGHNEFGWCEQDQDCFFEAYADNLRKWTDLKQPAAKAVRPHIEKSFMAAMEFIVGDVWGGVAHVLTRFPAEIEWVIWHGFDRGFEDGYIVGRYRTKTIADLLTIIFEAKAEPWKKLSDTDRIAVCLASLDEAENLLPEKGRFYFRSHLLNQIGRCL